MGVRQGHGAVPATPRGAPLRPQHPNPLLAAAHPLSLRLPQTRPTLPCPVPPAPLTGLFSPKFGGWWLPKASTL